MSLDFQSYREERRNLIDAALDKELPPETEPPAIIHRAMRYAIFTGGKRLRPLLTLAAAEAVGGNSLSVVPAQADREVLPTACALELIHAYSLIHDDLPALDNDDYRRGNFSSHKAFGEDIAILAGDALLTLAFGLISRNGEVEGIEKSSIPIVIGEVAGAVGTAGMIGGQVDDLKPEGNEMTLARLESIHQRKTGALIKVCLKAGAILGGGGQEEISLLSRYGQSLGLAFQIADDILDVQGEEKGKATYPALIGLEESRKRVKALTEKAKAEISFLRGEREVLEKIADSILERSLREGDNS